MIDINQTCKTHINDDSTILYIHMYLPMSWLTLWSCETKSFKEILWNVNTHIKQKKRLCTIKTQPDFEEVCLLNLLWTWNKNNVPFVRPWKFVALISFLRRTPANNFFFFYIYSKHGFNILWSFNFTMIISSKSKLSLACSVL